MAQPEKKILPGGSQSGSNIPNSGSGGRGSLVKAACEFIANEESFSPTAYKDVKQWSIGFGTGISYDLTKRPTMTVTRSEATQMLESRVESDLSQIFGKLNHKPLSDNALVALLSFGYNLGISRSLLMVDRFNNGQNLEQIGETMLKYFHCSEPDLKKRAALEKVLAARRIREVKLLLS